MSESSESPHSDTPPDRARSTGAALEAHYRFLFWLVPTLERFPRSQKFLLGDRIQHTALDVLERLIEATYTRRRGSHLTLANIGLEKLRFLCQLAHDLRYLDARRYEYAALGTGVLTGSGESQSHRETPDLPCATRVDGQRAERHTCTHGMGLE